MDEVACLNIWQVEWYPLRDPQKVEKPKDKNDMSVMTCSYSKCQDKYLWKVFVKCGACEAPYCSYECQVLAVAPRIRPCVIGVWLFPVVRGAVQCSLRPLRYFWQNCEGG